MASGGSKVLFSLKLHIKGRFLDVSVQRLPSLTLIAALHPVEPPTPLPEPSDNYTITTEPCAQVATFKINTIKALRTVFPPIGLKEAKEAADKMVTSHVDLGREFKKSFDSSEKARQAIDTLTREGNLPFSIFNVVPVDGVSLSARVMEVVGEGEGGTCYRCDQARALIAADKLRDMGVG
jgi:Ribosomal protein L7/L12 C-terminal domain.